MYNKEEFAKLLVLAQGKLSQNKFAEKIGVSSAYLTKLKKEQQKTAPSPTVIKKISEHTDKVSYLELMAAAGHVTSIEEESDKITAKVKYLMKDNHFYTSLHPNFQSEISSLTEIEKEELDDFLETSNKEDISRFINELNSLRLSFLNVDIPLVESNVITLPLYERVAAGALAAIDGVTSENVEQISLSSQFLGKYAQSTDLFSMQVNGDSMNKVINHGEIVIAKKLELSEYKDGDIVIFSHNGEYSLKRYAPDEIEGFILFKAESYDGSFKDIAISKDTTCELKIYGKVIFCGSTF